MSCPASDSRHSEKDVFTGLPQTHKTSAGVTFNLTPGPYASQVVLKANIIFSQSHLNPGVNVSYYNMLYKYV